MDTQLFAGRRFISVFILATLLLGLAVTVTLTLRPFGAFETRRKAAETTYAPIPKTTPAGIVPSINLNPTILPSNSSNSATLSIEAPVIPFKLALESRTNQVINVDIYGMKFAQDVKAPEFSTANSIKLDSTITDASGFGKLKLDPSYTGRTYYLFAQTPSHLRKAAENNQPLTISAGIIPQTVNFGSLAAGNLYIDANGYKDNIIDSFDEAALLLAWNLTGKSNLSEFEVRQIQAADLNGDRVIDKRDLDILMHNFGKKGDISPSIIP